MSARAWRLLAAPLLVAAWPAGASAQLATSTLSGRVTGPGAGAPAAARVLVLDALGRPVHEAAVDDQGRFRFAAVAPGTYDVMAADGALRSRRQRIAVRDGLPLHVTLALAPAVAEDVAVLEPKAPGPTAEATLSGDMVRRLAAATPAQALRLAIGGTPGWTSEDNGLLHFRGSDDGLLFVLDGVPVYERLDAQFGTGADALAVGSVRVLAGYVPPEYGLRAGGVIEVRSEREPAGGWAARLQAGGGSEGAAAVSSVAQGPLAGAATFTAAAAAERSDRFLDAVGLDNRHNDGRAARASAEVLWTPADSVVSLRGGRGGSRFEVPQMDDQSGDPRQRLDETFGTVSWQRAWSPRRVSQAALAYRSGAGRLTGDASEEPLFAGSSREHRRFGVRAALTQESGKHRIKAGLEWWHLWLDERFRFAVTDPEAGEEAGLSDAALAHGPGAPFVFEGRVDRPVASVFLQDSWRPDDRFVVDAGLRYDRSRLLLAESQLSPRLGAAFRLGRLTLRASVNRFFQPAQTEFLLLSSSPEAHALSPFAGDNGGGGADVRAERQTAVEAGGELRIGMVRADLALWRKWVRHQGDPNLFFGTTIVFPNSVDRGEARGLDVRLEVPRRRGWSGFVTYTLAKVGQFGPVDGGLFLEDDIIEIGPGTPFTPDHDQRHALTMQAGYEDERGTSISVAARYRSGTPLEVPDEELDELAEREGSDLVDFASGRVKPYLVLDAYAAQRLVVRTGASLTASMAVLNLTGARYAFNFGNPFSGTHFGAPRSLRVELLLALR
jgi:outer membrane receptor protein involved in Fe transport